MRFDSADVTITENDATVMDPFQDLKLTLNIILLFFGNILRQRIDFI